MKKKNLVVTGILVYLIVNLPLLGIIVDHGFSATTLSIMGHAPNQFIFLGFLYPIVIWALFMAWQQLVQLVDDEAQVKQSIPWRMGVKRGLLLIVPCVVAVVVVIIDTSTTPLDFYQLDKENAQLAADLNKNAMRFTNEEEKTAKQIEELETLMTYYEMENSVTTYFSITEAIEMFFAVLSAVLAACFGYSFMRLRGFIIMNNLDKRLLVYVKGGMLYIGFCLFVFSAWSPLREYNIFEIRYIYGFNDKIYDTTDPLWAYVFIVLTLIALVHEYIINLDIEKLKVILSIVAFSITGGLLALVKSHPHVVREWIGSGISQINLFFIFLFTVFIVFIGTELIRQARYSMQNNHNNQSNNNREQSPV